MKTEKNFANIDQVISSQGGESLYYGTSPLISEVLPDERVQLPHAILMHLQEVGILRKELPIAGSAVVHTLTDSAFVSIGDQHVYARYLIGNTSGNYQKGTIETLERFVERDKTTIVSGLCLFSASTVTARDSSGNTHYINYPAAVANIHEEMTAITIDPTLQPYEADAIIRLTQFMKSVDTDKAVTLALSIPRVEYYCYLLDFYEKGLVSKSILLNYFDEVDKRAQGLEALIMKRVPNAFSQIHFNALDVVADTIRQGVADGNVELFSRVLEILQRDSIFKQAIKRVKPQTFSQLGRLAYPVTYLQLAQDRDATVVAIENPEEVGILHETIKLLPGIVKKAQIVALYVHPRVLLRHETESVNGRRYLYFSKRRGYHALKETITANK